MMKDPKDRNIDDKGKNPDIPDKKKQKTSLKKHRNPFIRGTAKAGYTVWIIIMVVGVSLAFIVSVFLL